MFQISTKFLSNLKNITYSLSNMDRTYANASKNIYHVCFNTACRISHLNFEQK